MYFKTDLAFDEVNNKYELIKIDGYTVYKSNIDGFDFYLFDYYENCYELICKVIKIFLNKYDLNNKKCLVVGLGNEDITPDSLGPKVVNSVITTAHLEYIPSISKINPNVYGNTGIETSKIIKGVCSECNPDFIIVVDSLKSNSIKRLNKSIQITDIGIKPGGGVKNQRTEISKKTLNIPVIAIGVPFVVDVSSIMNEMIILLMKYLEKMRTNHTNILNKEDLDLFVEDELKKEYLGSVGALNDEERYHLINSFLEHTKNNLIVSSTDVDLQISKISNEISKGINLSILNTTDLTNLW